MAPSPKNFPDKILTLVTAPTEQPVSLAEAKVHCLEDTAEQDTYITSLILAATAHCDYQYGITGRALITQSWSIADSGPSLDLTFSIPITPVKSLTSITYFDSSNVSQTLDVDDFQLIQSGMQAYIVPDDGTDWPDMFDRVDALTVEVVAGFGTVASGLVPPTIKQAILVLVCHWFENRETVVIGAEPRSVPFMFDTLIAPHRRVIIT